jgi:tetratricopeptide (TPR) repeat protein
MNSGSEPRQYHPAYRLLAVLVPAAALVAIALLLWQRQSGPHAVDTSSVLPPDTVEISFVSFAPIDTMIVGGADAFARGDFSEAARLLSRARFFTESGIREGSIARMADNIDLYIGLAEFYRGYPERGIENVGREVERDPLDGQARWYLAEMLIAMGRRKEARSHLETLAGAGGPWGARAQAALSRL